MFWPSFDISYKDHVTNKEVCGKIQQAIWPHEDLTIVKGRKLQWYGHVSCPSGLAKTILQGTGKGEEDKADRGRDGKTTSGSRQAWRAMENWENWRKLVAKSLLVPQWPSRLRDWWWWWWWLTMLELLTMVSQERPEEDLCKWSLIPQITQLVKGLDWTELT